MLKIFQINIDGKDYDFKIESREDGPVYLSIPDPGGQMDSVVKYPEQLKWLEMKLEGFIGLKRIWNISWEIESEEALRKLEQLFLNEGGKLTFEHLE